MIPGIRIEGYAIVSADGMLADSDGVMPDSLKLEADQRFFADGLDGVAAVVHGRHSHEQQPRSASRRRLIVTTRVAAIGPDPSNAKALLWNPAGAPFEQALSALGVTRGRVGVVGGTEVFASFLDTYDLFHLSRVAGVLLPGGRPVFPDVPRQTPEEVLAAHGMEMGASEDLDAARGLTLTHWRRAPRS